MNSPLIGIIGGTGLAELFADQEGERIEVSTPFGPPSEPLLRTEWKGCSVVFVNRHGPGHRFSPSAVPYRANVFALKSLGVTRILASGATGSLREDFAPGDLVICDQVIDKTHRRRSSFFDDDLAVHVELADPFCSRLRAHLIAAGDGVEATIHPQGTYVCMEGPQFSTRAESNMHRAWGADLVGMTCMPEAKLAREAEICYALVAFPTDYDCWRSKPTSPDAQNYRQDLLNEIRANLQRAAGHGTALLAATVQRLAQAGDEDCSCRRALETAIWTDPASIDAARIDRLRPLVGDRLASRL